MFAVFLVFIIWFLLRPWMICRDMEQETQTLIPSYSLSYFLIRGFVYLGLAGLLFHQYFRQQRHWQTLVIAGLLVFASLWTFYWGRRFMRAKNKLIEKQISSYEP